VIGQIACRFVIGGAVVTAFAVLGDVIRTKSFAGLFGAAPSVAIATLALTVYSQGGTYASVEARSMIGGAVAFFCYAWCVSCLLMHHRFRAYAVTGAMLTLWLGIALASWIMWLR
jgi:hypothetical protein